MTPYPPEGGVSIIVPTTGRKNAFNTLEAMRSIGLQMRDEVLLVLDGSATDNWLKRARATAHHLQARTGANVELLSSGPWETPELASKARMAPSNDWGARARNTGLQAASKRWVGFMDDDDTHAPGALYAMRPHLKAEELAAYNNGRDPGLVISKMISVGEEGIGVGSVLWAARALRVGNVGTPMLWAPRYHLEAMGMELPAWGPRYEGDIIWAQEVTALLHEVGGPEEPLWVPHVTALIKPWAHRGEA